MPSARVPPPMWSIVGQFRYVAEETREPPPRDDPMPPPVNDEDDPIAMPALPPAQLVLASPSMNTEELLVVAPPSNIVDGVPVRLLVAVIDADDGPEDFPPVGCFRRLTGEACSFWFAFRSSSARVAVDKVSMRSLGLFTVCCTGNFNRSSSVIKSGLFTSPPPPMVGG